MCKNSVEQTIMIHHTMNIIFLLLYVFQGHVRNILANSINASVSTLRAGEINGEMRLKRPVQDDNSCVLKTINKDTFLAYLYH